MLKLQGTFIVTLLAGAVGVAPAANAQWFAKAQGPDVFGAMSVVAGTVGQQGAGLIVQCNSKDQLIVAFIESATATVLNEMSQIPNGLPAKLLIRVGSTPVMTFDAKLREWNPTHIGVVVQGRVPDLVSLVQSIGAAKGDIAVGDEIGDERDSENFSSFGSTDAMNKVMADCKLSDIGGSQQPGSSGS